MRQPAAQPTAPGASPRVAVERIVVHAPGDAAAGQRIVERLPAELQRVMALAGADAPDERTMRGLIERAVAEAAR